MGSITHYYLPKGRSLTESVEAWEHATGQGGTYRAKQFNLVYQPVLLAQAQAHYLDPNRGLDMVRVHCFQVVDLVPDAVVPWEIWRTPPLDPTSLHSAPHISAAGHMPAPPALTNPDEHARLSEAFVRHVHAQARLKVPSLPDLGMVGFPGESEAQFRDRAFAWAHEQRAAEIEAAHRKYAALLQDLYAQHENVVQHIEAKRQETTQEHQQLYKAGEAGLHFVQGDWFESLFDVLQMDEQDQDMPTQEVRKQEHEQLRARVDGLQAEYEDAVRQINDTWAARTASIVPTTLPVPRERIYVDCFGVGWRPVYQGTLNGQAVALLAL